MPERTRGREEIEAVRTRGESNLLFCVDVFYGRPLIQNFR